MTRHDEGEGRYAMDSYRISSIVCADWLRSARPIWLIYGAWIAAGVVEAVINLAFA